MFDLYEVTFLFMTRIGNSHTATEEVILLAAKAITTIVHSTQNNYNSIATQLQ
jgi:hypothetical protein